MLNFHSGRGVIAPVILFLIASHQIVLAQSSAPSPPATPQDQTGGPQTAQPPQKPLPQSPYHALARMALEANYAGPLADTIIQRWRDPVDGTICYLYLPISVPHGSPLEDGMVRYGANPVGSISCVAPQAAARKK